MKDKYSVSVFWSDEDECFIATCPEFPLLSAHGETREEATAEFQIVLEMAIESYQEDGIELPKPKTTNNYSGQFRIRMPKSLHKELAETALKEGVSLNSYAVSVIAGNHSAKIAYLEKTKTVERLMENLTASTISHNQTVQIYSEKIDLIANATRSSLPEPSHSSLHHRQAFGGRTVSFVGGSR